MRFENKALKPDAPIHLNRYGFSIILHLVAIHLFAIDHFLHILAGNQAAKRSPFGSDHFAAQLTVACFSLQ
jgi:hypothetical protein